MSAITITDAAHDYLADLLSKQNTPGIGIRIFITQPGTQYAETCIAYCKPGEEKPEEQGPGPEKLHRLHRRLTAEGSSNDADHRLPIES